MGINVITIDGPAGAGKSTVAKEIGKRFGYLHLDSGAIYRAIGVMCKERNIPFNDESKILSFVSNLRFTLTEEGKILVNGTDYTEKIRTPEGGKLASKVAKLKGVRDFVVKILREMGKGRKVVIDGRDAGTHIFPNAQLKIYLTASPEERAKRRYKELLSKGYKVSYEEVLKEVLERDESDKNRTFAPLTVPKDAVVIDTTDKTLEKVLREIEKIIIEREKDE